MCCGAASGEGTGGRAALMTDITSKKIKAGSGALFLFSYSLASCLPTAASHAAVSPCWSLKMVPYMAASKPERSSISFGLVSTDSQSSNSMNTKDGMRHICFKVDVHPNKMKISIYDHFLFKKVPKQP